MDSRFLNRGRGIITRIHPKNQAYTGMIRGEIVNRELEESLRSAKEDEEKRVELRCKRGEDAIRFNAIPEMKERFFDGMHNWNFNEEWKFSLNGIEEYFPDILRQIKERYWEILQYLQAVIASHWSMDFMHRMGLLRNIKSNWSTETETMPGKDATNYLAKLENPGNHYTWIASLIAAGTPSWVSNGSQIYKSDLNIQTKQWLGSRLTPSKNDNEIRDRAQQAHTSFPFPVLVMNICRDACVPEIERIEEYIWANQVLDITKIQDEMNPKLKKRKREPMHRVSELEGIGVRETLAALKADMIKVNTDVQQLQLNLSIFDALLPEDEGFEDERVDTDEEEMEDDHVTRELDEERKVELVV
ncbi:hypothetical protein HAX54_006451 [Datura stramonium]|uniref:Uncharacterized protein n=1 Tax=Datura stramonium TaxID=4076 RepID=A0ABS8TBR5_DATST|nr:hypothetical protein [Datura stramonium]